MSNQLPSFDDMCHEGALDITFEDPRTHRLRFTADVLGADEQILLDLLEPSGERKARVQFWLDENLLSARPEMEATLQDFGNRNRDRITLAGNIQVVPGGEAIKNDIHILERMLGVMNAANLDRRSYVVVIGGGAVLDAVGFAAAIAHRGIRLIRLPTTTLAQADSGVGVKNSVNLFGKKNWVGTFAVPWGVINDTALLSTLPDREFRCGFSEAVKVSLLKDPAMFAGLCQQARQIAAREMSVATSYLRQSVTHHLLHITRGGDPFENREARPLDFGHWSAHKLEVLSDFEVRHGEAVALGLGVDVLYSAKVHGLDPAIAEQVITCLTDLGLMVPHAALRQQSALLDGLEEFRQHLGGRLTVTMLEGVGKPIDVHEVDRAAMRTALSEITNRVMPRRNSGSAVPTSN